MAPTQQQARQAKALQVAGKKKAPKARVQRYLQSTVPQLVERGAKTTLLLHGMRSSQTMRNVLQELRALQAPHAKLLTKKNPLAVWNDAAGQQSLEFLATKNDAALVALATHNKKRPNHLMLGRTFDHVLLDTAELAITYFKSMHEYGGTVPKKRVGSKPLLLFQGEAWQRTTDHRNLQNLLTDFYRGDVVDHLVLAGIDHVIVFTAAEDPSLVLPSSHTTSTTAGICIHHRTYHVQLKKNPNAGSRTPAACLTPCGPDFDYLLRRTAWADSERYRAARPSTSSNRSNSKKTKKKNQSTNLFGETVGRLHLVPQNVDRMGGRKAKALRRADQTEKLEERQAIEHDLEREKEELGRELVSA